MELISQSSEPKKPEQLYVHEWLAIVLILGFLCLLTFIAYVNYAIDHQDLKTAQGASLKPQEVEFHVEGAVAKPGTYSVKVGTKVKEAIALAEPLLEADLRKIKSTSRLRNGQKIVVAKREMISISISGAISQENLTLSIPKGTRMNELSKYVQFNEDADCSKVDSKRYLKDQEKIIIPVKGASKQPRKGTNKKK